MGSCKGREGGQILSNNFNSIFNNYDILVIEDHKILNKNLVCFFQDNNISCMGVLNGAEALRAVRFNRFKIILSDLNLPDMKGSNLCKLISFKEEIPTFFMTGSFYLEDDFRNINVIKIFKKPLDEYDFKIIFNYLEKLKS